MTSPLDDEPRGAMRSMRTGVLVVSGTVALWAAVTWAAAASIDIPPWATSSWGRWDSGLYLSIAEGGYVLEPCVGVPNRTADDMCGNAGWFPLFPTAMRILGTLGIDTALAGRLLALAALVATAAVVWWAFLRYRPTRAAMPTMALVALFPGAVYYGAIFPISLVILSLVGAVALVDRRRWLAAGLVGSIATAAYTSGLIVGVLALVPLSMSSLGGWRRRIGAAAAVATPIVTTYGLVLANFERTVGRWNAAALTQSSYDLDFGWPTRTWRHQAGLVRRWEPLGWAGLQTALIVVLMALAVVVVVRHRRQLGPGEWGAALVGFTFWVAPLTLGPNLSIYRAEALLLPLTIVLARLDRRILWAVAAVALPVAVAMARLFFAATLI